MRTVRDRKVIPSENPTRSRTTNLMKVIPWTLDLTFDLLFKVRGHRKCVWWFVRNVATINDDDDDP